MNVKRGCEKFRGAHGATHQEWAYRDEAIIWVNDHPSAPNLIPFSKEMALWTQQKSSSLPVHTSRDKGMTGQPTNPYTYSLAALTLSIAAILQDAFDFSESTTDIRPIDAEISRIRYESELIIYTARFCEAAIKQMLYCTQIPAKLYERASMGKLLAQECEGCKREGKQRHDISLLGSLAHRFFLCRMLDDCAIDHLQIVARRRNLEAAHSESQSIHPGSADESKKNLAIKIKEIGHDLGHMADHIGMIEEKIIAEIKLYILSYPELPSIEDLSRIPIINPERYHQN